MNRALNPIAWWLPMCRQVRRTYHDDPGEMFVEVFFMTFLMAVHFVLLILAVCLLVTFPIVVVSLVVGVTLAFWVIAKVTDPNRED